MAKFLAPLLLLFALCFAEDSPRCKELKEQGVILDFLKMPWNGKEAGTKEECPCVETITCGNEEYCVFARCPSIKEPTATFIVPSEADLQDDR